MIRYALTIANNNKVILDGFIRVFGLRILQMGLGFATTFFLVKAISVDQYGYYNFVLSAVGIASIFSLTEMNNAVMQSISRGFYGVYRAALKKSFMMCVIGSAGLFLVGGYYYVFESDEHLLLALSLAAIGLPFSSALTQWKALRMGENRFKELSKIEGLNSIVTCVAVILSVLIFPGNYILPLALLIFIPALRNVFMIVSDLKKISSDATEENDVVAYGMKVSFFSGINLIAASLDRIILFVFLTPAAVALFSAADRLSDSFKNISQDLSAAMAPKLARQKVYTKKIDNIFMVYGIVMGAVILFFSFTALPFLFILIFGSKYAEAVPYAQALMCTIAIGNFTTMRFRYIRSQIDPDSYKRITLVTSFVRVGCLLALVPFFYIWGAVAAAFIARLTTAVLTHKIMKKKYLVQMIDITKEGKSE